jgi:hypothetical protein
LPVIGCRWSVLSVIQKNLGSEMAPIASR